MLFKEADFLSTLSKTSFDDNSGNSLIDRPDVVYNFDQLKSYVCSVLRGGIEMKSCDAFIRAGGFDVLIEFKNQRRLKVPSGSIRAKVFDSVYLLQNTFESGKTIEEIAKKLCVIVIYNDDKCVYEKKLDRKLAALAKEDIGKERIHFGLADYRGNFLCEVHTVDKDMFMKKYYNRFFSAHQ